MVPLVFSFFAKHAVKMKDAPSDYYPVRDKIVSMFPALEKWAFPSMLGHAMEVGGLGILARPTIQEMRGKQVSERSKHIHELAGLGTLAIPSAVHLLTRHP